jgi:N-acyl-L-homoserine lactone synthetase
MTPSSDIDGGVSLRIVRVTDERELVRLYAFRYGVFVEELGWMARKDRGAHILVDEFDRDAAEYAAYDRAGEVVGSLRAVPAGPLGLPLERCRVLDGYRDDKRLVELSRLAVAPAWRCTLLAALLMKAGYQWAERTGATHVVLDTYVGKGASPDRLYIKLGFEQLTRPYLDPDYLWKQAVVTFALDIEGAKHDWPSLRPSLHHFFTAEDERIDHGLSRRPDLRSVPRPRPEPERRHGGVGARMRPRPAAAEAARGLASVSGQKPGETRRVDGA